MVQLGLAQIKPWPFELFLFVILYAFLFYLMATLLYSRRAGRIFELEAYYFSRAALVLLGCSGGDGPGRPHLTRWRKGRPTHSARPEYPLRLGIVLALSGIAIWTRNRTFHLCLRGALSPVLIAWILRLYRVLDFS